MAGNPSPGCTGDVDTHATTRAGDQDDYEESCRTSVSILRTEAGRDPHDRGLSDLVGDLCTGSDDFRTRWAAHDVRLHRTGPNVSGPPSSARWRSRSKPWN